MSPFLVNSLAALAGWFAWNVLMLSMYKDENEQTFNIVAYAKEHWDNWAASLVFIPILLYAGYKGFKFETLNLTDGVSFGDCYYVCSGFFTEVVKMAWKKWKAKNS